MFASKMAGMNSAINASQPYPRRILLAVTGLTPQVVTETLYALACRPQTPWVPDEIHLVTTATVPFCMSLQVWLTQAC